MTVSNRLGCRRDKILTMNRVWRVIFAGTALFAAFFVVRLLPEAQFVAFASNTAPKPLKPYALSTWSNIGCRAKGRFQDREYCGSPVIDQIVADGKDAIPILISQITDSRIIANPNGCHCTMTAPKVFPVLPLVLAAAMLATPSSGRAQDEAVRLLIVVDKSCLIQPESDPLILGGHVDEFRDDAICHLESVFSSHHIEEKITESERSRFFVRVAEQEYVVQNPTDELVVFVVRQDVPQNWKVDSDPQPNSMDGFTAVFRLNAEPGQRVRLHVGMHRRYRINPN
jgi:hypothetical protein